MNRQSQILSNGSVGEKNFLIITLNERSFQFEWLKSVRWIESNRNYHELLLYMWIKANSINI